MITPSFSPTATERVLPKLAIDFTTAILDSRITFTRSENTATVVNSSGNVQAVNADIPRFDYTFGSGGACKGLLIEETRINYLRNNNGTGAVAGTPGTLPTNWGILANSGLSTAVIGTGTEKGVAYVDLRIYGTSTTTYYVLSMDSNVVGSSGQVWTTSMYASLVGGSLTNVTNVYTQTRQVGGAAPTTDVAMSLSATLTRQPSATLTLVTGATAAYPCIYIAVGANSAVDMTIRIGYPQLEQGAFATSVIPTGSGAVQRNADVATMTGTNFSSWFNQTQGAFYAEGYGGTVRGCFAAIDDDTMNNRYQMNISAVGPYSPNFAAVSGGVVSADLYMSAVTQSANIKQVGAYKLDSFALSAFGATPQTDTSGVLPVSVSMLRFGRLQNGNNPLNGCLKKFYYWPQRLTDAEVQAFSK